MSLPVSGFRSRKFYLLLILVIAIVAWWWPKKVEPQTMDYYQSLLCAVVKGPEHTSETDFTQVLKRTVEGSNSDYSLRKYHYDSNAGDAVIRQWNKLSVSQQLQARNDSHQCLQLMRSVA
ncbi:hypothetical protein [Tatumella citrea]|uniref:Uncharacterized protein n=1 Tax=Tatumella citrea TaxID=53336 RepID=A0A1Y0LM00_TATCI|nr:hypothetical protein [Tatumella citrea]ARU94877.1 hypothetical protein A7K98_14615 [Tatumella citrea]ARU98915.1 hypothetical protein A7K99_14600 [Tatumella citrea]